MQKGYVFSHIANKAVWDDFKQFYNANSNNPDMMPRSVLIENWANDYHKRNDKNPFATLNTQRIESGVLSSFLSSLHSLAQTDFIKLFYEFIAGEERSASLYALMNNRIEPTLDNQGLDFK